jgi:coenzyme F420 hydrogenase subunit beta
VNLKRRIQNIADVARWRLCCGCGMCVPSCPNGAVRLIDVEDQGLRPVVDLDKCQQCGRCLQVCPGRELCAGAPPSDAIAGLGEDWGPVLEVWEGYASDSQIRFEGSSGGLVTALSLFCLEKQGFGGVLHIGPDADHPLTNVAGVSRNREQLLTRAGSRYAPAAPCEGVSMLDSSKAPYVFAGKPCDVAAIHKWQHSEFGIQGLIGLTISIFCAGTPSTRGSLKILETLGTRCEDVAAFRYRGCGWPGEAMATLRGPAGGERRMSYAKAWGEILTGYVCLRCRLCPDATGHFADISCGDPWYRPSSGSDPGQSLVLVRTEQGRQIVRKAMQAGYVHLQQADPGILPSSQPSLQEKRRQLWGRLAAMSAMHVPVPVYNGFPLFRNWMRLPVGQKVRSLLGTVRRVVVRKLRQPLQSAHPPDSERIAGDCRTCVR